MVHNMKKGEKTEPDSYLGKKYEIRVFHNDQTSSHIRSALGRITNTIPVALNKHDKLPKYIVIVLEADLMKCINHKDVGIARIYSDCLNYLADSFHNNIFDRKESLPKKSARYLYPHVFWVALPLHKSFNNNNYRNKFSAAMGEVITNFKEMKLLKMRKHWDYENQQLFDSERDTYTNYGIAAYWASIDEAVEFWENGRKRNSRINKVYSVDDEQNSEENPGEQPAKRPFIDQVSAEHHRKSGNFDQVPNRRTWHTTLHRKKSKFVWNKDQAGTRTLPTPPRRFINF